MEVEHQERVSRMIIRAQGGAGFIAQTRKTDSLERREVQVLQEEERDVTPLRRCEEKIKYLAKHWQCDTEVQDLKDKPWENEEL